jgi:phosphatidylglycerol---prolipoprotein diacylglyceryl transferase
VPHPLLLAAYIHDIDPIAFQIGPLAVRWYGLSYLAGFAVAWGVVWWMGRTRRSFIQPQNVPDLLFYAIIGVLVGGRLGHVVFYDPHLFVQFSSDFPWWGVLAIHRGGMASHGGMIGALVALVLFARRFELPALHVLDVGCIATPPGLFFGRMANFINGELWGRPVPEQAAPPWWSVKFPQEMREWPGERLSELREAVEHVNIGAWEWDVALARPDPGVINAGIEHLIRAVQAGDQGVVEALRPLLTATYPSQIFQAISDGPALLAILALVWLRPRKPGIVGGAFLIGYGVMRIITEHFREPDSPLMFGAFTRGQALSAVMVLAGVVMLAICARRPAGRIGGLLRGAA